MNEAADASANPQQPHQAWEGVQQRGRRCSRRALRTRRHGLSSARNPVTGRDAIREALVPFVALGGQIHMRTAAVIENGDLASHIATGHSPAALIPMKPRKHGSSINRRHAQAVRPVVARRDRRSVQLGLIGRLLRIGRTSPRVHPAGRIRGARRPLFQTNRAKSSNSRTKGNSR
jgi:hypothetical protein